MKNSILQFLIFLLILTATVNIAHAQTKASIKAGVNFSSVIFEDETGDRSENQLIPGMQLGLSVDVPVAGAFYIQPGLLYSRKGFKTRNSWFAGSGNNFKVTASYIEVPLNFLYKPTLGRGKLLLGAGPYLGYGTGGEWEAEETVIIGDIMLHPNYGDVFFENDAMDGGGGNSYKYGKPLDYGANFMAGYEFFNKISAQFNVQLGLANLIPEYADGTKRDGAFKNIGFGISLGYKL
ncbi:MAG: porin family protein [Balneolales bacterium]